jgi:response regulator RpfG family c-di-GMP phosphodiesterase
MQATPRVLLVDDEPDLRTAIGHCLSELGYRCSEAHDPSDAMRRLSGGCHDLVLCDIRMPGEDGLSFLQRARGAGIEVPFVMMTGHCDADKAIASLRSGACDFIRKPIQMAELRSALRRALDTGADRARTEAAKRELEEKVSARTQRLLSLMESTLRSLAYALEERDSYTHGHSRRVAQFAVLSGKRIGLSGRDLERLRTAASLHDIGKIGIAGSVVAKPGALTAEEYAYVQQHSEIGARIISPLHLADEIRETVRHHHERWDGTGYPCRLRAEDIPLGARLLGVADAYDAMTSPRPYRCAFTRQKARQQLLDNRGTQFCPDAVDAFLPAVDAAPPDPGPDDAFHFTDITTWSGGAPR